MSQNNEKMTFEAAIDRMEQITARLSDGSLGIDEAMALYDEGVKLAAFCDGMLKEAQRKVTLIKDEKNA